jgi:hypothetical protein
MSDHTPQREKNDKPPNRYWQPIESFWDMKASHWVEVFLTVALIFVGVSQLIVYSHQASIMRGQLGIMSVDSAIHRAETAAVMRSDLRINLDTDGWHVESRWNNAGKTNAVDF